MYERCAFDFELNDFDYNSLTPQCKAYFQNKSILNIKKGWDDTSSQIATWIVLLFIPFLGYLINKSIEYINNESIKEVFDIPYEYKYVDEFERLLDKKNKRLEKEEPKNEDYLSSESDLDSENEEKKEFYKLFIEEDTPKGKIGLRYNTFTESFWWWSNTKDVPFKYLETVSRKYVIDNDCLDIYVDIRDELQKGVEKVNETKKKEEQQSNETEQEKNMQRVYAKFRKYNQKASRILGGTSGAYPVLKERCNRYTYRGNMNDFHKATTTMLQDEEINTNLEKVVLLGADKNNVEKLSFMEWKKLNDMKNK